MLQRIKRIWVPILQVIIKGGKEELTLPDTDLKNIEAMIVLLKPFKEISDTLEGETYVTVSMVHSYMVSIKLHLTEQKTDLPIIKKKKMLC